MILMGYIITGLVGIIVGATAYKFTDIILLKMRIGAPPLQPAGVIMKASRHTAMLACAVLACLCTAVALTWHWFSGSPLVHCCVLPLASWLVIAPPLGWWVARRVNRQLLRGLPENA